MRTSRRRSSDFNAWHFLRGRRSFAALTCLLLGIPWVAAAEPSAFWLSRNRLAAWELHFDDDLDGFTSAEEFEFGTDPHNSASSPYQAIPGPLATTLRFTLNPGIGYELLSSTNLTDFAPVPLTAPGGWTFAADEPFRFFRYTVPFQPNSDEDCLLDFEELLYTGTDPTKSDTDGDGLNDCDEVLLYRTDPLFASPSGRGAIAGKVVLDDDRNPGTQDDIGLGGWTVFVDADDNGEPGLDEPFAITTADGQFEIRELDPGFYRVRLERRPAWHQIFPVASPAYVADGFPDRVIEYMDSGTGPIPGPYGRNRSTLPGRTVLFVPHPEPVSTDIILGPLPPSPLQAPIWGWSDVGFLTLSSNSAVTVEFEGEEILDGPGPDLFVATSGPEGEEADLEVGFTPEDMVSVGIIRERDDGLVDLAPLRLKHPIRFVRLRSRNNGGNFPGFDLIGVEAFHFRPRTRGHHDVQVTGGQRVERVDFGVHGVDRPPRVLVSTEPFRPRAGQPFTSTVHASDDLGIVSVVLRIDDRPTPLSTTNSVVLTLPDPGIHTLDVTAVDSAGQSTRTSLPVLILNADGSQPDLSNQGLSSTTPTAPAIHIRYPAPGDILAPSAAILGSVIPRSSPITQWQVQYAPADSVDPEALDADDPDYRILAEGSGAVAGDTLALLPPDLPPGAYFLRVRATGGATAYSGLTFGVGITREELQPTISFKGAPTNAPIHMPTPILGTITSPQPLREWWIEYALTSEVNLEDPSALGPRWTRIGGGTNAVNEGLLARFDPTLLPNDSYVLRVTAWNRNGLGRTEALAVEVAGEAKLGQFAVTFRDLELPLAGIPISIDRTYNSLRTSRVGDFGYGWILSLSNPDLRETVPNRGSALVPTPFRSGARIYLNAPDGRRIGFTFRPKPGRASFLGTSYRAVLEADPGQHEYSLSVPEGDDSFLTVDPSGNAYLFFIRLPYNPSTYILTDRKGTRFTYHDSHGLQEIADAQGNRVTFSPDAIQHSSGPRILLERDSLGRITRIVPPDGAATSYEYSSAGDLASIQYPGDIRASLEYHPSRPHFLTAVRDPLRSPNSRIEYDSDGRVSAMIDAQGHRTSQSWDPDNFSGSLTDANGGIRQFTYDSLGNIVREVDPLGAVTTWQFSDALNPSSPTRVTNARGFATTYSYDSRGKLLTLTEPGNGRRLAYGYGTNGLLNQFSQADVTGSMVVDYDLYRRPIRFSEPSRQFTFGYNANGLLGSFEDQEQRLTRWEYDSPLQHPTRVLLPDGRSRSFGYDSRGALDRVTEPDGTATTVHRDSLGRIIRHVDAAGAQTVIEYDPEHPGLPSRQTDPEGQVTRFEYSQQGRVIRVTLPDGGVVRFEYDPVGNRTAVIDPAGNRTSFAYDSNSRLIQQTDPFGNSRRHRYDAVGNLVESIDRNGRRRTFEYDESNRIIRENWHVSATSPDVIRTLHFSYDRANRVTTIQDPDAKLAYSQYNDRKHPLSERIEYPGRDARVINFQRDSRDRIRSMALVGATSVELTRFDDGSLGLLQWSVPGSQSARVAFSRDRRGAVIETSRGTNQLSTNAVLVTRNRVDPRGWLNAASHFRGDGSPLEAADWIGTRNGVGSLTSLMHLGSTNRYQYDSAGQLLSRSRDGVVVENYGWDINGNRTNSHRHPTYAVEAGNRLRQAGEWHFAQDAEGNLLVKSNALERWDYFWDHRNRLTSIHRTTPASGRIEIVRYRYDGRNRRIAVERDGETRWTYYADQNPLAEFSGTGAVPTMAWLHGDGMDNVQAIWRAGAGIRWILTDPMGTPQQVLAHDASELARLEFDSFGNVIATTGLSPSDADGLGFQGRDRDPVTGLQWHRARWYDPDTGRFLSEDPLGFEGRDPNLYRFAANQPNRFSDPSGLNSAIEYIALTFRVCTIVVPAIDLWKMNQDHIGPALLGDPVAPPREGSGIWAVVINTSFRDPDYGPPPIPDAVTGFLPGLPIPGLGPTAESGIECLLGVAELAE
jgi:RHS repeat-associated protein